MGIGKMMSSDDMVEFFAEVSMILDDNDVETDRDFPEKYSCAMNRMRYLRNKEHPVPVKVIKGRRPGMDIISCGNCGFSGLAGKRHYHFCPNCGYTIKWPDWGTGKKGGEDSNTDGVSAYRGDHTTEW